ncbi:hypothetical protein FRC03_002851 [Tulasnella sp. 419]|nr:hypothetical protein FRC03_002851 [Tulasnella sp. 419]
MGDLYAPDRQQLEEDNQESSSSSDPLKQETSEPPSLFHSAPHPSHSGQSSAPKNSSTQPSEPLPPHPYDNLQQKQKKRKQKAVTDFDMDKMRSTLKQFSRDWSVEGAAEREVCYKPMLDALLYHFSDVPEQDRVNIRVLVPGAGLARLAWEAAKLGFACQGNEFSHFMLLASYFVLNRTERINQHTIYPYVHSFSNAPSTSHFLRPISFPDVLPADLPENSDFSLVAGDFVEVYGVTDEDEAKERNNDDHGGYGKESQEGKWNAVLTCFFIDTAKDIIEYLNIIHRVLVPGGVWINLGPLLWHYENNNTGDLSIEITLEDVKLLSKKIGFEIYASNLLLPSSYSR